ncbi:MAG: VOC family protein [Acidobacteriota bacterium]
MAVKPIPEGFHTVTPYLFVSGAAKLIDFMKQAFGAKEVERMPTPDGAIMHAQVKIGDSIIMLGDARDQWAPMPTSLYLYVNDTDAVYKRALQAGGTSLREPADEFYGDRSAGVKDPTGNMWWLATHIEDVAPDELRRRAEAVMQKRRSA